MKIDVKKRVGDDVSNWQQLLIDDRLPYFVAKPFEMRFQYQIENRGEFYLLRLNEETLVPLLCQRCAEVWSYEYHNQTELAICADEQTAEKYQSVHDVIVVPDLILDIKDVLVDNMHLFLPNMHLEVENCNKDQLKLMHNA